MKAQAVKGSPRPGGALLGIDPLKASKLSDFKGSTEKLLNSKKQPKTKKPSFAAELPPRHKQNPSLSGKQSVIKFMAQNLHEIVHRLGESRRSPMGAQARHMKSNSGDQPEYFNGILGGMPKGKPLGSPRTKQGTKGSGQKPNPIGQNSPGSFVGNLFPNLAASHLAAFTGDSGQHAQSSKKRVNSNIDDILKSSPTLTQKVKTKDEEKRSMSRKKIESPSYNRRDELPMRRNSPSQGVVVSKELMASLAELRMESTTLKATLSNEVFRMKQSCLKESRYIEGLYSSLIECLLEQKDQMLNRLDRQSSSIIQEINAAMRKIDTNLKTMDRVIEAIPTGKRISRGEAEALGEMIEKIEIEVASEPKKLALCESQEDPTDEIIDPVLMQVTDHLSIQVYEQDFQIIEEFNSKVRRLKSEFAQTLETSSFAQNMSILNKENLQMHNFSGKINLSGMSGQKKLPFDSPREGKDSHLFEQNSMRQSSWTKKSPEKFLMLGNQSKDYRLGQNSDENKENLFLSKKWPEVNLAKNKIDKISLECDEKLKIFGTQPLTDREELPEDEDRVFNEYFMQEAGSPHPADISNLECCDEVLTRPGENTAPLRMDGHMPGRTHVGRAAVDEDSLLLENKDLLFGHNTSGVYTPSQKHAPVVGPILSERLARPSNLLFNQERLGKVLLGTPQMAKMVSSTYMEHAPAERSEEGIVKYDDNLCSDEELN